MSIHRKKAFTLLEMVVAGSVLAAVSGLLILSAQGSKAQLGADSLAEVVAAELRSARIHAIQTGAPVAVAFPSDAGSLPYSQSLYVLEGNVDPRRTRVANFAREFQGNDIFLGSWGGASATPLTLPASKWNNFNPATWSGGIKDGMIAFTPDGTAHGSNLPSLNQAYHLLVCAGINQYSGNAPGSAVPNSVGQAFTVEINALGTVTVRPGVSGNTGSVTITKSGSALSPPTPPTLSTLMDPVPNPDVPLTFPKKSNDNTPGDAVIPVDGYVSLDSTAVDSANSGEPLYVNWSVTPDPANKDTSGDKGQFSVSVQGAAGAAMSWNNNLNKWGSSWQWRPPETAKPGDVYLLGQVVQDKAGHTVSAVIKKKVTVAPPGHVLFESNRSGRWQIYSMNGDGTSQRPYDLDQSNFKFTQANVGWPSPSVDGSRVVFVSDVAGGRLNLFITDRLGLNPVQVTHCETPGDYNYNCECSSPALSPGGDKIAYKRLNHATNKWQLCVISVTGRALAGWNTPYDYPPNQAVQNWGSQSAPNFVVGFDGFLLGVDPDSDKSNYRYKYDRPSWKGDNDTFYFSTWDAQATTTLAQNIRAATASGGLASIGATTASENLLNLKYHASVGIPETFFAKSPTWSRFDGHLFYTADTGYPFAGRFDLNNYSEVCGWTNCWTDEQPCPFTDPNFGQGILSVKWNYVPGSVQADWAGGGGFTGGNPYPANPPRNPQVWRQLPSYHDIMTAPWAIANPMQPLTKDSDGISDCPAYLP